MSDQSAENVADAMSVLKDALVAGRTSLGIELGSTRIKACLVLTDDPTQVVATGSHEWENQFVDRTWTYSLEDVWSGVQAAYSALSASIRESFGVTVESFDAIGISAMMHGYLAFDAEDRLLTPFRTWRNTSTGQAATELTDLFGVNIPLRWSIAHLHQAVRDEEAHVAEVRTLTTLAGYVHWRLTGSKVLGVGDASGVFPIDPATKTYDAKLRESYDSLVADRHPGFRLSEVLPSVLVAGEQAGNLTSEGAALLDPAGVLRAGIAFCPPEGDAGTGMVATCAVAPRTGNVSAGTSIFSMVVLERSLTQVHDELDVVTTPAGDPVAMVHCNNGASELSAWVRLFADFASVSGQKLDADAVFETLFTQALSGETDAGGLLAYNHLSGEPIAGLSEGRPMVVRTPDSTLSLPNFMRAQIYGVFATLALGMRVLAEEGVKIDAMYAHGGLFKTAGVAQRMLAGAIDAPVAVAETAGEGGAWGIAVLAAYTVKADGRELGDYLSGAVFGDSAFAVVEPSVDDVSGFARYLERYRAGLAAERAAVEALA
ncbi:sugar (pentulose or hexulose) kinase [Microbacterium halimionae]|uniref:Sugar (Pentulose or hexulose) kinase n=1 Tax=Microbacterium halimionae TaxID=1526413 RepID=A0A7W3JLW5_9MICO|nr:FGGY-family carbohydrate kinase [Microbacterium halimionae]MBA8815242.1 sugar (pentulose or hexulose) kinase [Microbacterium halimionae]NII93967.1 sugar (pentulose or hexulose) kinase [Microbacterium halimionae]